MINENCSKYIIKEINKADEDNSTMQPLNTIAKKNYAPIHYMRTIQTLNIIK